MSQWISLSRDILLWRVDSQYLSLFSFRLSLFLSRLSYCPHITVSKFNRYRNLQRSVIPIHPSHIARWRAFNASAIDQARYDVTSHGMTSRRGRLNGWMDRRETKDQFMFMESIEFTSERHVLSVVVSYPTSLLPPSRCSSAVSPEVVCKARLRLKKDRAKSEKPIFHWSDGCCYCIEFANYYKLREIIAAKVITLTSTARRKPIWLYNLSLWLSYALSTSLTQLEVT